MDKIVVFDGEAFRNKQVLEHLPPTRTILG